MNLKRWIVPTLVALAAALATTPSAEAIYVLGCDVSTSGLVTCS